MSTLWPLFDLRLRTPRLELRVPDDDDVAALAEVAAAGVHDPDYMPFGYAWTDLPSPQLERGVLQYHWRRRAELTPESWNLPFVAVHEGAVIGTQDVKGEQFALTRTISTGSWLGRRHQGRGLGKEMRAAVLELVFAGLGAEVAETSAFDDNHASLGVTHALGYEANGEERFVVRGAARRHLRFRLDRDRWLERRTTHVEIEGLEPCLELLGLGRGT